MDKQKVFKSLHLFKREHLVFMLLQSELRGIFNTVIEMNWHEYTTRNWEAYIKMYTSTEDEPVYVPHPVSNNIAFHRMYQETMRLFTSKKLEWEMHTAHYEFMGYDFVARTLFATISQAFQTITVNMKFDQKKDDADETTAQHDHSACGSRVPNRGTI